MQERRRARGKFLASSDLAAADTFEAISRARTGLLLTDERWTSPTFLYRYREADGWLLYVGISHCLYERDKSHWTNAAHWRSLASSVEFEMFPTRYLAERAEEAAIHSDEPEFNVLRRQPAEPARDHWFLDEQSGEMRGVGSWTATVCGYDNLWRRPVMLART